MAQQLTVQGSSVPEITESFEEQMQRITNFIHNARRLRRRRPISNVDSSWNKRLKLTHKIQMKKRKPKRKYKKRKKVRHEIEDTTHSQLPVIIPQCIFSVSNICSERS